MQALAVRRAAFLLGCLPARLALAWLAKHASRAQLRVAGCLALVVAAGFGSIYVLGLRKTGIEVMHAAIWWDALRPVHAALWLLFALYSLKGVRSAWLVIVADAALGLAAFLLHHTAVPRLTSSEPPGLGVHPVQNP